MTNAHHPRQGIRDIPDICSEHGIGSVILCPGSRNASLILSFTKNKSIECISITDERSAGYFALGNALYSQKPVAIVCTSGTAALNLAPSIAEAYYQHIPLVVFTADRPREWIDQADGQTIRQNKIFSNYCKEAFEVPVETANADDLWFFDRIISQAIDTAVQSPAGPVHINVPLREPLYETLPVDSSNPRIIRSTQALPGLSSKELVRLKGKWENFRKKLVIFGTRQKNESLNSLANQLAEKKDTAVIAENLSNICGPKIIYAPEVMIASLSEEEKKEFQPELLITVGDSIVSKRMKQYLKAYQPVEHWHIASSSEYIDTFKSLTAIIQTDPVVFLNELVRSEISGGSVYSGLFAERKMVLALLHDEYISHAWFSDVKAIAKVLTAAPKDSVIHLSNSAPVRYSQLFQPRQDITYYSNRGTSGIDGCVSTAAGSAFAAKTTTLLITGDLAFIYDSNGLWNNYLMPDLKIVVMNNNGGSIFTLIDTGSGFENIRPYIETPHRVNIRSLAAAYGVGYIHCSDDSTLKNCLEELFQSGKPGILEIKTDQTQNIKAYKDYYHHLKRALAL